MKTANKIAVARALHRLVRSGRAVAGRSGKGIFTRRGIVYELDLTEGIDLAIYLGGMFERRTALALGRLVEPSALVLDIGANIGAHTLPLADLVGPQGRVMAFEPTDFAFRKLKRNLDLNPSLAGRVESLHCFLSGNDQASVPAAVYSSWPLDAEQGLHAKHLGREMQTEQARARSLDRVLSEHAGRRVQLVKLDVDGYECEVLRGATSMVREMRPIFMMELSPYVLEERGASLDELLSYFLPNGYSFYNEWTRRRLPSTTKELQRLVGDGESINVVARVGRHAAAAISAAALVAVPAAIGETGVPFVESDGEAADRERPCDGHAVNRVFALEAIGSSAGVPIMNEPFGTTTISGQTSHSLKLSRGFKLCSRSGVGGSTPLLTMNCCGGGDGGCAVCSGAGGGGLTGFVLADASPARTTTNAPAANAAASFEKAVMRGPSRELTRAWSRARGTAFMP
jgi:FkbM family methyltransferase